MAAGLTLCLGAYLFGALPFGMLIRRSVVARFWRAAYGPGMAMLLLDLFKGFAPAVTAQHLDLGISWTVAGGLASLWGHRFSPFLGFHGGRGVAVGAGFFLALWPAPTVLALLVASVLGLARHRAA